MGFLRTTARGRSEATPARALTGVASIILVVVVLLVALLFLLQQLV
jgi:uncharacterized membrane protein YidH (DUF202 family)